MLTFVAVLAVTHTPYFSYHGHHHFPAEPSIALYTRGSTVISVTYEDGDFMFATVLEPAMLGLQLDAPLNTVTLAPPTCATLGSGPAATSRPCTSSHAKNKTGERSYEPFGESDLVTTVTAIADRCSVGRQICHYNVMAHADNPYVFVVGTEEEVLGLWFTGLPIYVDFISRWLGNYAYGYAFLAYFTAAIFALFHTPEKYLISSCLAAVVICLYLSSATSRVCQIAVAGFGWGQTFSFVHWLFAAGIFYAVVRRSTKVLAALTFLSIAVPLRLYFVEPSILALLWIALELDI
jgi:hypothetical protein